MGFLRRKVPGHFIPIHKDNIASKANRRVDIAVQCKS